MVRPEQCRGRWTEDLDLDLCCCAGIWPRPHGPTTMGTAWGSCVRSHIRKDSLRGAWGWYLPRAPKGWWVCLSRQGGAAHGSRHAAPSREGGWWTRKRRERGGEGTRSLSLKHSLPHSISLALSLQRTLSLTPALHGRGSMAALFMGPSPLPPFPLPPPPLSQRDLPAPLEVDAGRERTLLSRAAFRPAAKRARAYHEALPAWQPLRHLSTLQYITRYIKCTVNMDNTVQEWYALTCDKARTLKCVPLPSRSSSLAP